MMNLRKIIYNIILGFLTTLELIFLNALSIFEIEDDIPSKEHREIMSDPENRKIYLEGLRILSETDAKEVMITLKNNEKITLFVNYK